jgi:hypothetical protein
METTVFLKTISKWHTITLPHPVGQSPTLIKCWRKYIGLWKTRRWGSLRTTLEAGYYTYTLT